MKIKSPVCISWKSVDIVSLKSFAPANPAAGRGGTRLNLKQVLSLHDQLIF